MLKLSAANCFDCKTLEDIDDLTLCSKCDRVYFCSNCRQNNTSSHDRLCLQIVRYYSDMMMEKKKLQRYINTESEEEHDYFVTKVGQFYELDETQKFIWSHSIFLSSLKTLSTVYPSPELLNEICERSFEIERICGPNYQSQPNTARSLLNSNRRIECYQYIHYWHGYYANIQVPKQSSPYDNMFQDQLPDMSFPVELIQILLQLKLLTYTDSKADQLLFQQHQSTLGQHFPEEVEKQIEAAYCGPRVEHQVSDAMQYMTLIHDRGGEESLKQFFQQKAIQEIPETSQLIESFYKPFNN